MCCRQMRRREIGIPDITTQTKGGYGIRPYTDQTFPPEFDIYYTMCYTVL